MSLMKDLYLEEVERIAGELEEQGLDPDLAYDRASNSAYAALTDRLADMADNLRMRAKESYK